MYLYMHRYMYIDMHSYMSSYMYTYTYTYMYTIFVNSTYSSIFPELLQLGSARLFGCSGSVVKAFLRTMDPQQIPSRCFRDADVEQ